MNNTQWKDFKDIIQHHLTDEDDPKFWQDAINKIYQYAETLKNKKIRTRALSATAKIRRALCWRYGVFSKIKYLFRI